MNKINIRVGDTFYNAAGTECEIIKIFNSGTRCTIKHKVAKSSHDIKLIIIAISTGYYRNYQPVNTPYKFKIGDTVTIIPNANIYCTLDFETIIDYIYKDTVNLIVMKGSFGYKDSNDNAKRTVGYETGAIEQKHIKLINTNKSSQNEKISKIKTNSNRERTKTAISSSQTRQIASSSKLIGNTTPSSIKRTRIGRFEISQRAIST